METIELLEGAEEKRKTRLVPIEYDGMRHMINFIFYSIYQYLISAYLYIRRPEDVAMT
jgi:hypothetical protein